MSEGGIVDKVMTRRISNSVSVSCMVVGFGSGLWLV